MRRVQTEPYSRFDPREYLTEYYVGLSEENDFLLRFDGTSLTLGPESFTSGTFAVKVGTNGNDSNTTPALSTGADLFAVSIKGAPRGQIMRWPATGEKVGTPKVIVPEGDGAIVTSFAGRVPRDAACKAVAAPNENPPSHSASQSKCRRVHSVTASASACPCAAVDR